MTAAAAPNSVHTTSAPVIGEAEAAALVQDAYGFAATVRTLTSERDKNFHVVAEDGRAFVLKIGNAAEDVAISDFQARALHHIRDRAPGLPVPEVQPSRAGEPHFVAQVAAGTRHVVRMLTYLPGIPLHAAPASPGQTRDLGRCLGRLDVALAGFDHPGARHELIWDLQHIPRLRPYLRHVADPALRRLAEDGLDRFEHEIGPRMAGFRRQVVHNDFNPHNVLVDSADPARVTGVLDFGDMVETPLVNDVAVAGAYQVEGPDPLGRLATFVAAYHAVNPLRDEEMAVLFDLVMLRQAMTLIIAEWRASLYPENRAYVLRNHPRAAAALATLAGIGRSEGEARLRTACSQETTA